MNPNERILTRESIRLLLFFILALLLVPTVARAAWDTEGITRADIGTLSAGAVDYQVKNDVAYKEIKNTFRDGGETNYYSVTPTAIAETPMAVAIGGATYDAKTISGASLKSLRDGAASIFKANTTIFFAPVDDTDDLGYFDYSKENLSRVRIAAMSESLKNS